MNLDLTEIACVIDRSGSMNSIRSDAIGGFNSFLKSQQEEPGEARVTLVLFDHEYQVTYENTEINNVPPLDNSTYEPRGTTALLDAIGRTIDDVGTRLGNTAEENRPGQVIVAILTDGLENASRQYSRKQIFDKITHQREKYNWEFVFLAANQDAISAARELAIDAADAEMFTADEAGAAQAFAAMDSRVAMKRKDSRKKNSGE